MALDFDGVDDQTVATITALTDADYTLIAWVNADTAGESNNGFIMCGQTATTPRNTLYMATASLQWGGEQRYGTTDATAYTTTSNVLTAGVWACVALVHRASDNTLYLYQGDLDTPMADVSANQVAGVGTFTGSGTNLRLGCRDTTVRTFNGRIGPCCMDQTEWPLAKMEAFRLGRLPIPTDSMRALYLLDSSVATQYYDMSGDGATLTMGASAPVWADNPPVGFRWGDTIPITQTAPAGGGGGSVPVMMDYYRRRRVA